MHPLPPYSRIKELELINVGLESDLGECGELSEINLLDWNVEDIQSGFLKRCKKLTIVRVKGRSVTEEGLQAVGLGVTSLRELRVYRSPNVKSYSTAFSGSTQLRKAGLGSSLSYVNL